MKPVTGLAKHHHCQLHGEPSQAVIVRCKTVLCPAKPCVAAGDIYNGGKEKARNEAIAKWNVAIASTELERLTRENAELIETLQTAQRIVDAEYQASAMTVTKFPLINEL
jgi:hypothetical protein